MEKSKKRALKLANKKVAFVGSVNEHNVPNIQAMSVVKHIGLETFYFVLSNSNIKASHYKRNWNACIYFTGGLINRGLLLEGIMKVFHDVDMINFLRKVNYKKIEENDFFVLQFIAKKGRLYRWFNIEAFEID